MKGYKYRAKTCGGSIARVTAMTPSAPVNKVKITVKQKGIVGYLEGEYDLRKEDLFINITLYRMPGDLVREFALKFAYKYPGGISEALQDLMKNAVKE